MRHFIGHLAGGEIEDYYIKITSELNRKFGIRDNSKRVPPHLTFKYPFEVNDTKEIENRIFNVTRKFKPVEFQASGFDRFPNDYKTIFIAIKLNRDAISLFKSCMQDLGELEEEQSYDFENYTPHISIARHLDKETSDAVWDYLMSMQKPEFELSFDNLTLFNFKDEAWHVKKTYKIG